MSIIGEPPLLPPHTCPTLDGILREINRGEDMSLAWVEHRLEEVRAANQTLRINAEHFRELAEELQTQLNDARGDIRALEDQVADLTERLGRSS